MWWGYCLLRRWLYRCLLRAHPRGFREKFAGEMLWIYDQRQGIRSVASLFADALASLARQWVWRPGLGSACAVQEPARQIADGPVFQMFESSMPSRSALMQGAALAVAIFAALAFVARHGGRQPQWSFEEPYFRETWVVRVLDADHDGIISAAEIANAPAALRTLDTDHDGALSAAECGAPARYGPQFMQFHPVLAALDRDHDGQISASEIANAPAALRTLDRDGDGDLTTDELRPGADARLSLLVAEFRKLTRGRGRK
jgi:EF hand